MAGITIDWPKPVINYISRHLNEFIIMKLYMVAMAITPYTDSK